MKIFFIFIFSFFFLSFAFAENTNSNDQEKIHTLAGDLLILKNHKSKDHPDDPDYNIFLNGKRLSELYGNSYFYYQEPSIPIKRMIITVFIGGFSDDLPVVIFYDFSKKPPDIEVIKNGMDVEQVKWENNKIYLKTSQGWYQFKNKKLSKLKKKRIEGSRGIP